MIGNRVLEFLNEIDDARELLDGLTWLKMGPIFNARFLRRFCFLHARDQGAWLASERDTFIEVMVHLTGCAPSTLRYDVERLIHERDDQREVEHLERITGMRDEPEAEPAPEDEADERYPGQYL